MIDWRKGRQIVHGIKTKWAYGIPLEPIPAGLNGQYRASVLVNREWKGIYFLVERASWSEDDYFRYAEQRFKEMGIGKP